MPSRKKVQEMDMESRLKASLKQAGATGEAAAPPPPKEEEAIPELADLIEDRKARLEVIRLLTTERELAEQEKAAKAARKPVTAQIKTVLGTFKIGKAAWNGWRINYYESGGAETVKVSDMVKALLAAGLKQEQIQAVKDACVKRSKYSYTLRIAKPGEKDENGEE